ncbi:hypothetical protein [Saccharopolyspora shandongensis]|uniref:hypothetical protein n=1 Tax=Saccharopolyspora shandongensis TaxID=418495 RepID=UPI003408B315
MAHENMDLRIAGVLAQHDDTGPAPVPVVNRDTFVYVVRGEFAVTADGVRIVMAAGDGLNISLARDVSWLGMSDNSYAVWGSA